MGDAEEKHLFVVTGGRKRGGSRGGEGTGSGGKVVADKGVVRGRGPVHSQKDTRPQGGRSHGAARGQGRRKDERKQADKKLERPSRGDKKASATPSKEGLDDDMDAYMGRTVTRGKDNLDAELDGYFKTKAASEGDVSEAAGGAGFDAPAVE